MTSQEVVDRVNEYYDECQVDYAMIWGTNDHLSMHYGYHEDGMSHDEAVVNLTRVVSERADISEDDSVLDAGCGVGGSTIWIAENHGAEVTGINVNENQIEKARRGARRHEVDDLVDFQVMDFTETGFPDESFSVVWAVEAACHAEDKRDFLDEMYRVLEPGGRIVVADGFLGKDELSPREQKGVDAMLEGMAAPNLPTYTEFEQLTLDAGFTNLDFEDRYDSVYPSARRIYLMTLLTLPVAIVLRLLRIRSRQQTLHLKAAYHQYPMLKSGAWVHGLLYAEKPE